ncbi:MAG TPA: DNA gyrase subunit A [Candidatus Scybalomonas excrementigallinarum]|nr:DNA gyrase subunit A [Candidatus Scybalomonas excrementigallinarum]
MDDSTIFDKVQEVDLVEKMEKSYIDYAMSVIAARALPDIRDGLKPVQRRILYAMIELNNGPDKPHRKCARIVGDTMGKYHPHGDSSIYEALVKLAQEWSTRYPLIDGHGNFGSVDGDGAAAMRYTEARLSKISMEMLADINKNTVNFTPNFDESEKEPAVLPSRYPNLLVNGTSGIAVGMATNIPPHNLNEVIDAVVKLIDNQVLEDRDTSIEELLEIVKGPDFPTGATILGRRGIEEAYRTGRGKIKVRAVTDIEPMNSGKQRIVVTELPYMVNKAKLIEKIASLVKEKKIEGIAELRDESDRNGMRICIELKKDVNANVLLNQLYKHTQMQDTFGVNALALVNGEPKVLNLHDMVYYYLEHQKEVITRRTQYELNKAKERAHILEGLLKALDHIDEVIQIIRSSENSAKAKINLIERFGLSDAQAQAIIDMRLKALTGLEREKLENEYNELMAKIAELQAILNDEKQLLGVIREEILITKEKFGDARRTDIGFDDEDITIEDLIPREDTVIAMTKLGYIKRMTIDNFKSQNRGGKGIKGMQTIDEDFIEELFMTTTHHYIMFFTNSGRVYRLKGYEIPESSRTARGTAIVNLLQLQPSERITAVIPIAEYEDNNYLFMATKNGIVKKTSIKEYENIRKSGLAAINLREGDELIEVKTTDNEKDIILVTKFGQCIRFNESEVRETGRVSMGVIGMNLIEGDEVIGMQLNTQGSDLLIVSEYGMGKRTSMDEFTPQRRGGKGVKCYRIMEKTGNVVGVKAVDPDDEVMLITTQGIVIRLQVNDISELGRITSGVKLINMQDDITVASIAKVRETTAEVTIEEVDTTEV